MGQLLVTSLAQATVGSYNNAFRQYKRFHLTFYPADSLLPMSTTKLAQFIAYCHDKGLKGFTITAMISAFAYIHKLYGLADPTKSFRISKLLFGLRKHAHPDKQLPITYILQNLLKVIPQCFQDVRIQILCQAMFLLAFYAPLCVGEFTTSSKAAKHTIQINNISFSGRKGQPRSASVRLATFKHAQPLSYTETEIVGSALCLPYIST